MPGGQGGDDRGAEFLGDTKKKFWQIDFTAKGTTMKIQEGYRFLPSWGKTRGGFAGKPRSYLSPTPSAKSPKTKMLCAKRKWDTKARQMMVT